MQYYGYFYPSFALLTQQPPCGLLYGVIIDNNVYTLRHVLLHICIYECGSLTSRNAEIEPSGVT